MNGVLIMSESERERFGHRDTRDEWQPCEEQAEARGVQLQAKECRRVSAATEAGRGRKDASPQPSKRTCPADTIPFFQSVRPGENKFWLFQVTQFVVICYSSPRKPKHHVKKSRWQQTHLENEGKSYGYLEGSQDSREIVRVLGEDQVQGLFDGFKDHFQLFLCQNFSTGESFLWKMLQNFNHLITPVSSMDSF